MFESFRKKLLIIINDYEKILIKWNGTFQWWNCSFTSVNVCRSQIVNAMLNSLKYVYIKYYKKRAINLSPSEKVDFIRQWSTFFLKLCGIGFIDPNFKTTAISYVPGYVILIYVICTIYTIFYYGRQNQYILGIAPISVLGIVIPVSENCSAN